MCANMHIHAQLSPKVLKVDTINWGVKGRVESNK